jgi:hypothetical protein
LTRLLMQLTNVHHHGALVMTLGCCPMKILHLSCGFQIISILDFTPLELPS